MCLLVAIFLGLLGLVARVNAAPAPSGSAATHDDSLAIAQRYASALTGEAGDDEAGDDEAGDDEAGDDDEAGEADEASDDDEAGGAAAAEAGGAAAAKAHHASATAHHASAGTSGADDATTNDDVGAGASDDMGAGDDAATGDDAGDSDDADHDDLIQVCKRGDAPGDDRALAIADLTGDPDLAGAGDDDGDPCGPRSDALGASEDVSNVSGEVDGEVDGELPRDDGDRAADATGELAMLEAEQTAGGAIAGDDASFASASAGADETYEAWLRRRPSRWGRLDVGLELRRFASAPMNAPAYRSAELWLFATWRP
ncbi:MAG TPA: hypothetical protein VH165_01770 [Kofleriaceae bacterium]|nr:hypothetical protein [Kofleriaceae bacterium]